MNEFPDSDAHIILTKGLKILLRRNGSHKWLKIGAVNPTTSTFIKRENARGLHVKTDSFSIPYAVLVFLKDHNYQNILIVYEKKYYKVSVEDFFVRSQFLYFKSSTEKKKYLSRDCFEVETP